MKTIGEIRCNIDNLKIEPNLVEDVKSDLVRCKGFICQISNLLNSNIKDK